MFGLGCHYTFRISSLQSRKILIERDRLTGMEALTRPLISGTKSLFPASNARQYSEPSEEILKCSMITKSLAETIATFLTLNQE